MFFTLQESSPLRDSTWKRLQEFARKIIFFVPEKMADTFFHLISRKKSLDQVLIFDKKLLFSEIWI